MSRKFSLLVNQSILVGLLGLLFFVSSCKSGSKELIPDVSNVHIDYNLVRFDSMLYTTDSSDIPQLYQLLQKEHHDFLLSYIKVMTTPTVKVKDTVDFLQAMQHHGLKRLFDTTQMIIGDFQQESKDFAQALRYIKYYFPEKPTPTVYTYESEFAYGAYTYGDQVLATGLDFFLGHEFPYNPMTFPDYIKRNMTKDHIVSTTIRAHANDLVGDVQGEQFLDYIISNGKVLYLLDHFLPYTPDSIFLGYTADQEQWCKDHEYDMWSHFIHENLLYSTKLRDFRSMINPSPTTMGMPPESPGRTGNWMGWQIIKAYMKRHPKTTLPELMALKDSKKILKAAKYKPKAPK